MSTTTDDRLLAIRYWKFIFTTHARARFDERVQPVVGSLSLWGFCRQMRLASAKEARAIRKQCPTASSKQEEANQLYLWHPRTQLVAVGEIYVFQTRVEFAVLTFLDMGGMT